MVLILRGGWEPVGVTPRDILASDKTVAINTGISQRPSNKFTDARGHWAWNSIKYVSDNGILLGITPTTFGPNTLVNRAMFMTIIHRVDGEPDAGSSSFSDVPINAYFREAVAWGQSIGIAGGTEDGRFLPEKNLTREDLATFLFRYASRRGVDITYNDSVLNQFNDRNDVSGYASKAMKWAVSKGLINGRSSTQLVPKGISTRAEVATIMEKFIKNLL